MNWFESLFIEHSAVQAVALLGVIIAIGLGLGKLRFYGISLGVTFVFFTGILAGHLGFSISPDMLMYAQNFGLVLFVYELGLQVGPGFFSSFRSGGVSLNMWGLLLVVVGTLTAIGLSFAFQIPMSDMTGILCGATTNTPALGAAQQALEQLGMSASGAALSCAVTYPLGVVGVILAMIIMGKVFVRPSDLQSTHHDSGDHTYVAEYCVTNPGIFGLTIKDIRKSTGAKFVISRLWRSGLVSIPGPDQILEQGDRILLVTNDSDVNALTILFGEKGSDDWNRSDIDWDRLDRSLVSRKVVISKPSLNGKKLGALKLRNHYHVNISRVSRAGIRLLATPGLVLQLGDVVTLVGDKDSIDQVAQLLGNSRLNLKDPNLASIFLGIVLGLVVGSIPIFIPGISSPIRLGLAGGPIVVGILMGRFGPQFHLVTYTTRSANLMLRGIGLSLYLACLGLSSGAQFLDTVMRADGLLWIACGFLITVVPTLIVGVLAMRAGRLDFGESCGMMCGAMANPMALTYAGENTEGDESAVSYATVYPLAMFMRVVIAQILILLFI